MWDIQTSQNRFAILRQVHTAAREATRARRIAQFVAMLSLGETPYPQEHELPATGGPSTAHLLAENNSQVEPKCLHSPR
jgi:hypothetical protein